DVVIIGAGTAGSLLAARLSQSPTLRILVLKAGENRNDDANVRTPGLQGNILGNPVYDWQYQTVPEQGLNGRVIQQPRGKLWGGSTAINSHALVYPSRKYHDEWNNLLGRGDGKIGPTWDWEGVGKYYRKFQQLQQPSEAIKRELGIGYLGIPCIESDNGNESQNLRAHEKSGGIRASFPATPHVLQRAWTDAIRDIGYSSEKDPVSGAVLGGSTTTSAVDAFGGEISHAGVAFLEPSTTNRENLCVRSNVLIERIVLGAKW
ncbi:GMC oxidoreductase, partial [Cadophora sp. DSE1049]